MQCPACKSACPDDVRFCLHCGQYLGELDTPTLVHPQPNKPISTSGSLFGSASDYEPPKRRRWPLIVALSVLAGIVLMVVGGVIALELSQRAGESPRNNQEIARATPASAVRPTPFPTSRIATPEQTPTATPERSTENVPDPTPRRPPEQPAVFTIINRQFIVPARHFVPVRFRLVVPSTISGQFQAYGGNNDIAVAIMSEEEFENYRNGGYYRAYYNTGYIMSDTPTVNLPPGTYYLTFDDRKALIIGKTVVARFIATPRN